MGLWFRLLWTKCVYGRYVLIFPGHFMSPSMPSKTMVDHHDHHDDNDKDDEDGDGGDDDEDDDDGNAE